MNAAATRGGLRSRAPRFLTRPGAAPRRPLSAQWDGRPRCSRAAAARPRVRRAWHAAQWASCMFSALPARTTMTVTCRAQRATCQCPFLGARHLGRGLWCTSSATGAPGPLFPAPGACPFRGSYLIGLQGGALHLAQPTTVAHYASGSAAAGHCHWHSTPGIRPSNA